jgi:capsular exopolysaccharide synthesis family protein
MSRIDEALRRASQGAVLRPAGRLVEGRRVDERVLEEYPVESKALQERSERVERVERRAVPAQVHAVTTGIEQQPQRVRLAAGVNDRLVIASDCDPLSVEQYRRLAASLHEIQVEKGLKTVVVTSAVPKEGKTLTAVNLALTFSASYGRRVLLIDADLRASSVHRVLGTPNDRGLSDVLRSDRVEAPILSLSPLLSVLPAGHSDSSPLAGISSERMRLFLQDCAARYDWVILDTPPLGLVSDAQLLARLTQAAVFVIRAGSTPYSVIERALTELGREYLVGTVLNGVEETALPIRDYYGDYSQAQER